MASIKIDDFIDIGTGGILYAVSYQIYKVVDGKEKIIDQSLEDKVNLGIWHSMLPKLPEDKKEGESDYYADEPDLRARVKLHMGKRGEHVSAWYELTPANQNYQAVLITEEGKPDIETSSDAIDLQ